MHKFWSLESRSQISSLGIFDEVSASKVFPGLGLEGYGLNYITNNHIFVFWNLRY